MCVVCAGHGQECAQQHTTADRTHAKKDERRGATHRSQADPFSSPTQLLDRWSLSAIAARLDKRNLQQQADVHRLFLVTEHWARAAAGDAAARAGGEAWARALAAEAKTLGHKVMMCVVLMLFASVVPSGG